MNTQAERHMMLHREQGKLIQGLIELNARAIEQLAEAEHARADFATQLAEQLGRVATAVTELADRMNAVENTQNALVDLASTGRFAETLDDPDSPG